MKTAHYPKEGDGLTLIELMVTLAVLSVLLVLAVPSFLNFQRNAELTSTANTVLASINAARGEAIKRGRYAMMAPTDGANWSSGWIVFVDIDRTQTYSSDDIIVSRTNTFPASLTVTGTDGSTSLSAPYILYDASGYARLKNATFATSTIEIKRNDVTGAELLASTRRLKIIPSGRTRICTPTSSTDTRCSDTGG